MNLVVDSGGHGSPTAQRIVFLVLMAVVIAIQISLEL
jgi:hypothetical protein